MNQTKDSKFRFNLITAMLLIWAISVVHGILTTNSQSKQIPYSQFLIYIDEDNVESVTVSGNQITGILKKTQPDLPKNFSTLKMDDPGLVEKLSDAGIKFEAVERSTFFRDLLSWTLPILLMAAFWWFIMGKASSAQSGLMSMGKSKAKVYVEKDLKTRFSDVAGVDEAKIELTEVVEFLKNPQKYGRLGGRMPKGLLLVGPPGTGKTLLARAVAGEAQVPFFSINGSEFVELFVGLGAARVRDLFSQARTQAPCIIFIDELDAIGKSRGISAITGSHEEKEQTLNQLLAELDGFDTSPGVVLLAATNRPEILDPALLRSGRFDRQIMIDKPDKKGREEILKIHLKKILKTPENSTPEMLAGLTAGFSGADLENLVNEAALIATRRNADKVSSNDFTAAIERIVGGLERKSRILSNDEKKRVAYHEMGHALVSFALEKGETVHKVSIIPRGIGALGYTMRRPTEDRYIIRKSELENKIAVLLGGRASEMIFLKDSSTGAADDLDKATDIARSMITRFGMSEELGLLTYDREMSPLLGGSMIPKSHDYSEHTACTIDEESIRIVDHALTVAMNRIKQHQSFIEEGVRILLEKETLDEDELKKLWAKSQPINLVPQGDISSRSA